jgi:hypothetical protein
MDDSYTASGIFRSGHRCVIRLIGSRIGRLLLPEHLDIDAGPPRPGDRRRLRRRVVTEAGRELPQNVVTVGGSCSGCSCSVVVVGTFAAAGIAKLAVVILRRTR